MDEEKFEVTHKRVGSVFDSKKINIRAIVKIVTASIVFLSSSDWSETQ